MQFEEISSIILNFIKKYWLPLALSLFGTLFILYGLISLVSNKPKQELEFSQSAGRTDLASKSAILIAIDIEGAVVSPGVYKLESGSIVQDVLIAAKGLDNKADRDYVAKNINLAQRLSDGQKIYIPRVGEEPVEKVEDADTQVKSGLININLATLSELDSLPGVGPVTSDKIIAARPFTNIDELLSKKIVTGKVFEQIKDKITAN